MMRQFFVDDTNQYSCMRLMAFIAFVSVLGVWVWGNVTAGHYVPLGYAEAGIITAAFAGKAAQARFEYGCGGYGYPYGGGVSAALMGSGAGAGDSVPAPRDLEGGAS
jgi:hypothetical protein